MRARIADRLETIEPYPRGRFRGRGIVVCAGGPRMFLNAYVLLRILRETLRSALPIQLWHLGPQELSAVMRALIDDLDVEPVDAFDVRAKHPSVVADGWQLKPYAVLHSRFEEILLLDADQVPVRDPAELFDWPQYKEAGALFWPDIVDLIRDNPVWRLCGLEPRHCPSLESGQAVIAKQRYWRALNLVVFLNEHADIFYQLIYGDKDTFLIGSLLADTPFSVVPYRPFFDTGPANTGCLVQRDFAGAPLFQHRTNSKWTYAQSQAEISDFVHEKDCLRIIGDLRSRWNGRLFDPPPARSFGARAAEDSLTNCRMRFSRFGEPDLEIEFLAGHQFGNGRGPMLQNWYVSDDNGLVLVIRDVAQDTYRFKPEVSGRWTGHCLLTPQADAWLATMTPPRTAFHDCDRMISDLIAASGLIAHFDAEGAGELAAALRLINRVEPGAGDRLRAFATKRCAGNPHLRDVLSAIADEITTPRSSPGPVYRPAHEVLRRGYGSAGWPR
jgi:Mannosyltransferase putative